MWFHMATRNKETLGWTVGAGRKKIALWCNFRIDEGAALKAYIIRLPASTTYFEPLTVYFLTLQQRVRLKGTTSIRK
jgi:hypothetical protein